MCQSYRDFRPVNLVEVAQNMAKGTGLLNSVREVMGHTKRRTVLQYIAQQACAPYTGMLISP